MLKHISISAQEVLNDLARKRVGKTLNKLDEAGCDESVKLVVKRQMYGLKKDIEELTESCDATEEN